MTDHESTVAALHAELDQVEAEIARLDRLRLARATALLCDSARIEQGLPTEIGVVRSVTALEDTLQLLQEETEDAEGT